MRISDWSSDVCSSDLANAVLRANSRGYVLQSAEAMPTIMFAYMRPSELELSPAAEAALRANQYDIDAWKQNKMLTFNEKWTFDSQPDLYDEKIGKASCRERVCQSV